MLPVTARGNEVAPAREDTEKEHARKKERRTQHGNQRGGRPREDAVLLLRGQAAKGWCNQLEDGRHDPFPPYLRPEVPTSPTAASKPSEPWTGLNDPSAAPPEPNAALVPNLPAPRCRSTV